MIEDKPPGRLWLWALLLGLALASIPSMKIARFLRAPAPTPIPSSVRAGLPITVSDVDGEIQSIDLDGAPLARIKGRGLFIGAVGLYDRDDVAITGLMRRQPKPIEGGPLGLIYASPLPWFSAQIRVEKQVDADSASMRLPASNPGGALSAAAEERRAVEAKKVRELLERQDGEADVSCWTTPAANSAALEALAPGSAIRAAGPGTIELAEDFAVPGKIAMIYHGGGLFSRFMRMGELLVRPGERVVAGQIVGFSPPAAGTRARWDIVWKGKAIRPAAFLDLSRQLCEGPAPRSTAAAGPVTTPAAAAPPSLFERRPASR